MSTFLGVCVLLHTLYFMPFNLLTVKVKMAIIKVLNGTSVPDRVK